MMVEMPIMTITIMIASRCDDNGDCDGYDAAADDVYCSHFGSFVQLA